MWLKELYDCWIARPPRGRRARQQPPRRHSLRLRVEQLEDRTVPSSFTAASVSDLIADINAANLAGGSNTITLAAGTTFSLTAVDNTTDGATGLPVIATSDNLGIVGNGDTIARSATGTPAFRLFDVAGGASLTLANLTLQGGLANGSGVAAEGGAIYNHGNLTLNSVIVQHNTAAGFGGRGLGGGVCVVAGTVTLNGATLSSNSALGGQGVSSRGGSVPAAGYNGAGGGLCVLGGTVTLNSDILSSNTAQGGSGSNGGGGGDGLGGGLYVQGGTVSLFNDTVEANSAKGGRGGSFGGDGLGEGGGLYINAGASACLDAFTVAHVIHNRASSSNNDIFGSYTIC